MLYGFVIIGRSPTRSIPVDYDPLPGCGCAIPLTLLWYLGMMNAINFIDGLDGLLSGLTAISAASLS